MVIQLDDERYWPYVAVDPETNDVLQTKPNQREPGSSRTGPRRGPGPETRTSMTPCFSSMTRGHGRRVPSPRPRVRIRDNRNSNRRQTYSEYSKKLNLAFLKYFDDAVTDDYLKTFAFPWDRLIRTLPRCSCHSPIVPIWRFHPPVWHTSVRNRQRYYAVCQVLWPPTGEHDAQRSTSGPRE